MTLPAERTIRSLQRALGRDARVKAAWLKGSFGRGADADRHSDIDLYVWLAQTLINLLDNALKHTPPGGRVSVTLAAAHDQI